MPVITLTPASGLTGAAIDVTGNGFTPNAVLPMILLLNYDGELPDFAVVTDGKTTDVKIACNVVQARDSIVKVDREYCDFELFHQYNQSEVFLWPI